MLTLRKKAFDTLLGFAIGMAWVFAFVLAIFAFIYTLPFGIFASITFFIISFVVGLIPVFIFEAIFVLFESYEERKKQTKLLEEILKKMDSKDCLPTL